MQTQPSPAQPATATRPARPIACRVNVTIADGSRHCYDALAPSTSTAAMNALTMFGICKVSVQAIQP